MILGIISSDYELIEKFKKIDLFTEIRIFKSLEEVSGIDILLLSDKNIEISTFADQVKIMQIKTVFLIASSDTSSMSYALIESQGIIVIPPRRTTQQVTELVCGEFGGLKSNENVFVFYGADDKVGVTNISQSVAEMLSENKNLRIFYTFLNGRTSTDYLDEFTGISIDSLRTKLDSGILTDTELVDACTVIEDNLFVLKGVESLISRRYFTPTHVEKLLGIASKKFDIVIVDGGSNIELGLVVGALNSTKNKFLIVTQQEKTINNYLWVKSNVLDLLKIKDFTLIINKFLSSSELNSESELAKKLELQPVTSIPSSDLAWQSEKEHKTLFALKDKEFTKRIAVINNLILRQLKITPVNELKSTGLKNLFSKRG